MKMKKEISMIVINIQDEMIEEAQEGISIIKMIIMIDMIIKNNLRTEKINTAVIILEKENILKIHIPQKIKIISKKEILMKEINMITK